MGDVLKFAPKIPATPVEVTEDIQIMACGHCDNVGFFLSTDGRIYCVNCRNQVDAEWGDKIDQPVA